MVLKWINTTAFAAMVIINALANLLPIGGNTTGQVSEAYPNLFTPAPFTFAIWGVIYLLMAVFILYQWELFDGGKYSAKVRNDIGPLFAVSCAANIVWIFLWHNRMIGLSTLCIALLLITLYLITGRLGSANGSWIQRIAAKAGFSLYYGWIIAAALANLSVWLTKLGWNGLGLSADFRTAAALLAGAVITFAVVVLSRNRIAGLAVMWAFAGILYRHFSPVYHAGTHPYVIMAGVLSELIILTAILLPLVGPFLAKMLAITRQKTH